MMVEGFSTANLLNQVRLQEKPLGTHLSRFIAGVEQVEDSIALYQCESSLVSFREQPPDFATVRLPLLSDLTSRFGGG